MNYLFAAYTVFWIILCVYLSSLWRKQQRIARDLETLKQQAADMKSEEKG